MHHWGSTLCQAGYQAKAWVGSELEDFQLPVSRLTCVDTSPRLLCPRGHWEPWGGGARKEGGVGVSISTAHSLMRFLSSYPHLRAFTPAAALTNKVIGTRVAQERASPIIRFHTNQLWSPHRWLGQGVGHPRRAVASLLLTLAVAVTIATNNTDCTVSHLASHGPGGTRPGRERRKTVGIQTRPSTGTQGSSSADHRADVPRTWVCLWGWRAAKS